MRLRRVRPRCTSGASHGCRRCQSGSPPDEARATRTGHTEPPCLCTCPDRASRSPRSCSHQWAVLCSCIRRAALALRERQRDSEMSRDSIVSARMRLRAFRDRCRTRCSTEPAPTRHQTGCTTGIPSPPSRPDTRLHSHRRRWGGLCCRTAIRSR